MALNEMIAQGAQFNMPDPVAQYNKLAQMQQYQSQNELNRQEAIDKATERQRIVSERTKRSTFLTQFGEKLAERGVQLNKTTVAGMISSGVPEIEKLGFEALKAMQFDESYNTAMDGGAAAAPTPAPMAAAVPRYDSTQPNVGVGLGITPEQTADSNPNRAGAVSRYNPTTGEFEIVPLRDQKARGLFNELTKTYLPVSGSGLVLTASEILDKKNERLADLTQNPPEKLTPQNREEIQSLREEIIRLTPTNAMAPQAPAPVANAMAPQAAPTPAGELERLIAQRSKLSRMRPENPGQIATLKNTLDGIDKQIEVLNRQEEPAVRLAHAIAATFAKRGTPEYQTAYNKALGEQTDKSKDKVNIIGVAKGTGNPVYLDSISDEQYIYVADANGKQKRKLYSGPVDRSTSNISQNVSNKVDAFIPASETAQAEFMKETRQTFGTLKNAQPTLDNIEAAKALIPTAKGFMGTGGEPLLLAASFLNNRLGTKIDTKGVVDATELRSRLFFGILENLKKLDSQPSAGQQAIMQEALGNLGTDPNALGRVLDAFGDSIRTKVDSHNIEVSDAETRGVKFPYNARIVLKPKSGGASNPHAKKTDEQIKKELGL